jgi:hypothetical protein
MVWSQHYRDAVKNSMNMYIVYPIQDYHCMHSGLPPIAFSPNNLFKLFVADLKAAKSG